MGGQRLAISGLVTILAGLVAVLAWRLTEGHEERTGLAPRTAVTGTARVGGPFSLVGSDGRRVTDVMLRGKPLLIVFGYSASLETTPALLQTVSAALDTLGPAADGIVPLFITLDPVRDTPSVLGAYTARFHPRLVGLTGSEPEITEVARAFHVHPKITPSERPGGGYDIDYAALVYLLGPDGRFRRAVEAPVAARDLAAAVREVLQQGNR